MKLIGSGVTVEVPSGFLPSIRPAIPMNAKGMNPRQPS